MSELPFILSFDSDPTYYGHDMFPNRLYRQHHPRHHIPLDFPTLGLIARLGAHAHHLHPHKTGEAIAASHKHQINNVNNNSKHDFEVHLDVGLFKPEEITVKVVNDCVVVEGKHEEREDDHGVISRHFQRRYVLPKNCNLDDIVSTMTTDGVLTVSIPKPAIEEQPKERIIEIKQIGPSDLFLHDRKHNTQHEVSKTESTKNHNEV